MLHGLQGQRAVATGKVTLAQTRTEMTPEEAMSNLPLGGDFVTELQSCLTHGTSSRLEMLNNKIFRVDGVAVPVKLHRGYKDNAVILRCQQEYGISKQPRYDFVKVRAEGKQVWYGQLRLALVVELSNGKEADLVYVRWLEEKTGERDRLRKMERWGWQKSGRSDAKYDVMFASNIVGAPYFQPSPIAGQQGQYFRNQFL